MEKTAVGTCHGREPISIFFPHGITLLITLRWLWNDIPLQPTSSCFIHFIFRIAQTYIHNSSPSQHLRAFSLPFKVLSSIIFILPGFPYLTSHFHGHPLAYRISRICRIAAIAGLLSFLVVYMYSISWTPKASVCTVLYCILHPSTQTLPTHDQVYLIKYYVVVHIVSFFDACVYELLAYPLDHGWIVGDILPSRTARANRQHLPRTV